MADLHTCRCGFTTRICRDEVTAEQWATYETYYRMAYDWAADHLPTDDRDAAEEFACRYAGEEWDSDDPCSFPTYLRIEQNAEARAEAKRRDAKWRADRRKAKQSAATV